MEILDQKICHTERVEARPIPTYETWKRFFPKMVGEDLESENEGARELQRSLDVCMAADLRVQEAMHKKESQWKKKEQDA